MSKVLFVVSAADHWTLSDGTEHPTGFWAEELVAPYDVFTGAGHEVDVATPGGIVPTVDPASLEADAAGGEDQADEFRRKLSQIRQLHSPMTIDEVVLTDYVAVFYPGGHGPMEDLSSDERSAALLVEALETSIPLGVVCHAPAALLATAGADGSSPFSGFRLTGFTNTEEEQAGLAEKAPWLLQDRLEAMGVQFQENEPWSENVVVDRTLYTGQNPASSGPTARRMLDALSAG